MKKLLKSLFTVVLFVSAFILTSCSGGNKNKEKISIGYIPIADCSQLFVAYEKGFFKDEGLEVELIEFQGGPQILQALGGKSIEIGFSNLISLVYSNAQGIEFRAITGGPVEDENHIENAIMVLKTSKIRTAQDLENKVVAVNSKKNIVELMFREYMLKYGADPDLVEIVEFKFPQMQGALLAGKIDAMAIIEPFVTIAQNDKNIEILSNYFTEVLPRTEISSYHADLSWIKENEETVKKFQSAMNTATKFCVEKPFETRRILVKYAKGDPEVLNKAVMPNFTDRLSVDNLQILIEKMVKNGWLDKHIQARELIY
jgi:NitT/TauT family transport system substrate-binding protein